MNAIQECRLDISSCIAVPCFIDIFNQIKVFSHAVFNKPVSMLSPTTQKIEFLSKNSSCILGMHYIVSNFSTALT